MDIQFLMLQSYRIRQCSILEPCYKDRFCLQRGGRTLWEKLALKVLVSMVTV